MCSVCCKLGDVNGSDAILTERNEAASSPRCDAFVVSPYQALMGFAAMFLRHHRRPQLASLLVVIVLVRLASPAAAQHFDIQVQAVDGKLTTGAADFDDGSFTLGQRVWTRFMNSSYAVNNPGFNAAGTMTGTPPPGSAALPGAANLNWDFLPMKVGDVTSSLLYWDGVATTPDSVAFGPPPGVDYSLSLFGKNNVRAAADGTGSLVPGGAIDTTAADGFMHIHRFFFLDNDHDDNNATDRRRRRVPDRDAAANDGARSLRSVLHRVGHARRHDSGPASGRRLGR